MLDLGIDDTYTFHLMNSNKISHKCTYTQFNCVCFKLNLTSGTHVHQKQAVLIKNKEHEKQVDLFHKNNGTYISTWNA